MAGVPTEEGGRPERPFPGADDLTSPDFLMTFRMGDINKGPSWFFTSKDRGHTWQGPWTFPRLDLPGIAARTDYLVTGKQDALAFMTAAKSDGREGRPFVVRTSDGGRSFSFVSWIGPEPPEGFVIMPSTVRLDDGSLVTATRRQVPAGNGIDIYRSADAGLTWTFVTTAVSDTGRGNPPSLVKLRDGRLAVTYGYRAEPYSIKARISRDGGKTWDAERILRADAADWDLGYPRSVQRPDGKIVTVYYYNDRPAVERYIAATIWDPGV
jgi:BNR repeat-like domain